MTPLTSRAVSRRSDVDVRKKLAWTKWDLQRRRRAMLVNSTVMLVNRTDRRLYICVFPGQEERHNLESANAEVSAPVGSLAGGFTKSFRSISHAGSFEPTIVVLDGLSSAPSPPEPPAFRVFDI